MAFASALDNDQVGDPEDVEEDDDDDEDDELKEQRESCELLRFRDLGGYDTRFRVSVSCCGATGLGVLFDSVYKSGMGYLMHRNETQRVFITSRPGSAANRLPPSDALLVAQVKCLLCCGVSLGCFLLRSVHAVAVTSNGTHSVTTFGGRNFPQKEKPMERTDYEQR
ncbi:hypothetical protein OUZ56_005230 [Daphnia magna]|uniref:Uncharacterized protein n=1 Tax=Daphnia magna TaxID=35525 RepID=A0ABQ9YS81_9CRUS|nr:hypothetical protein OUZ56_005230 [Daphnia magna]